MKHDYTAEIIALQAARTALQVSEKTIAAEVKAKYRDIARAEIESRIHDNKVAFSRKLKAAHDSGVPASLLRSEVLRTNSWDRWTYWRDLAGIEPDRVLMVNAKAEREARSRGYVLDGTTFTVYRTEHGEFNPPLVIPNVVTDYDSPVNPIVPLDAIRPEGEEMAEFDAEFFKNAYVDVWKLLVEIKKGNIK